MTIPGRILIVDNVEDDVRELIQDFMKKGENVTYTGPFFEEEDLFKNVRLVIFDYYLIEDSLDDSLNTISLFLNNIYKKTKFFLVAVWSGKITEDNGKKIADSIRENYRGQYAEDMPGILLPPFSKKKLNSANLIQQLEINISENPDLELFYEIENILDRARDLVVSSVYETGNWFSFVGNLEKEVGKDSINRHIVEIYLNIIKRYLKATTKLDSAVKRMLEVTEKIDDIKFGKIFSLQNYYHVSDTEMIWTGDVLTSENNESAVVITPECNFAHDTFNAIRVIECERINHRDLSNPEMLEGIRIKYELNSAKAVINALFKEKSQLRQNYYSIPFLLDEATDEFFHLILDFDRTKYLSKEKTISELGYSRVCRVDTPLINRIQQSFATHCSRIGTMAIPKELIEKLKDSIPK